MPHFKKIILLSNIVALGTLLTGCQNPGLATMGDPTSWGSYKCVAVNPTQAGFSVMGWAVNRKDAAANALDKCRSTSSSPRDCRIGNCYNES